MEEIDSVELSRIACGSLTPQHQRQIIAGGPGAFASDGLVPGSIAKIFHRGLNVNGLAIGEQVRIGTVLLQISSGLHALRSLEKVRRVCAGNLRPSRHVLRVCQAGRS